MGILEKWSNKKKGLEEGEFGTSATAETVSSYTGSINSAKPIPVMMNDGVNICAKACAACWDTKIPDQYLDRAAYVGRRTKIGHTSVIEHSNVVFYMCVHSSHEPDLIDFLANNRFLHTVARPGINLDCWHLLVGGSWRAYADLYLTSKNIHDNFVMLAITNFIYENIPSAAFRDIIDKGILSEDMFANMDAGVREMIDEKYNAVSNHRIDENINIVNCDSIAKLKHNIEEVCPEVSVFNYKDLLEMVTVTIEFNGMSRIITQQLTRHRNAITQESQRYVDYSGAPFNSPVLFKPERYNPKKLYEISFGGQKFKMNLQNLGDAMNKIYPQLRDKTKLGDDALIPEDARAYLTNNTQCGKIYITFTYYNLIKFLQLREDSHAQAEIRGYATRIGKWFRNEIEGAIPGEEDGIEWIYNALNPRITDTSSFTTSIALSDNVNTENTYEEAISDEEYASLYQASIEKEDEIAKTSGENE